MSFEAGEGGPDQGHYCPICEKSSARFLEHGRVARKNALCPHCGLLERHRVVWVYFQRKTNLFDNVPKDVLHVAPEKPFEDQIRPILGAGYITADLHDPRAMVKMDITDIAYDDASFDVIYCSHVLEHVVDDRRALSEFYRVLRPGGWAALMVPVTRDKTIEDPSVVDRAQRLELYGHEDHVRRYGPDFIDRVREAGFLAQLLAPDDILDDEELRHMGLTKSAGDVFHCVKAD